MDLENLILVTAQTGDESEETKLLGETFLLPLLKDHQIRLVQVAKAGLKKAAGITVLSDTRSSQILHTAGDYKLSTNLIQAGTVPRFSRPHICAQRWKGEVIDSWLQQELPPLSACYLGYNADESKRARKAEDYEIILKRYMGYNADESTRARHAEEYGSNRFTFTFPLIERGWTREDCLRLLHDVFGVEWRKSACTYCPFAEKVSAVERYRRDPKSGGFTIFLEHIALALNPRMQLFSHGTAKTLITDSGNQAALDHYEHLLNQHDWAIYRVQRIYKMGKKENSDRRTTILATGSRAEMEKQLHALAQLEDREVVDEHGLRVWILKRDPKGTVYPTYEECWVICPALVVEKCRNALKFEREWLAERQLELLPLA
jgi:hypothetical protein